MAVLSQSDKFKAVVLDFLQYCNEMIDVMTTEGKLKLNLDSINEFKAVKVLVERLDGNDLIKKFTINTHVYWEAIRIKDKDFFNTNYAKIFGDISGDKLSLLRYIFVDSNDDDIKESMWSYIHSFIKISIRHVFNLKLIEVKNDKDDKGGIKTTIRMKAMPEYENIKVLDIGKIWQVELYPNFLAKK